VVTQIYRWRVVERLSYDEVADRLNLDLDRYPPPEPILGRGRRAIGAWTKGSVRDILSNPKYTGHMVYNRRKNPRRDRGVAGKVNPSSEWIWSSKPRHEPLTTKAMYDAGTPIGKSKKGSRTSDQPNGHPATARTYRLRSHVICELCGRRLHGKTRRISSGYSYYACESIPAHHSGKDWFDTHPKSLWVREDKLLDLVRAFFARRIFGPDRVELLAGSHCDTAVTDDGPAARPAALRGKIKELERQQANVVRELREYQTTGHEDLDQEWRRQLRDSFAEITNQRKALQAQLAEITKTPEATATAEPGLLDQLPIIDADFGRLPEDLERELFAGFQLQVRYHQPSRRVTLRVTIDGEAIPHLAATGRAIMAARGVRAEPTDANKRPPAASTVGGREGLSLAGRAPGRIRTCAPASGGRCSIP
jgi:site-specific DNA recombinase